MRNNLLIYMGSPYYLTVIDNDNGMCFVYYLLRCMKKINTQMEDGIER
jgi:hypothetical protein